MGRDTIEKKECEMKVSDLGPEFREDCIERGLRDSDEITPREAVKQWPAWGIGAPSWAEQILDLYAEAATDERESILAKR
jgi:hypothetical protein